MRKFTGVLLMFVISVMMVAACSPAAQGESGTPGLTPVVSGSTQGVLETPPVVTEAPTLVATTGATEATTQTSPSGTQAVTEPIAGTPTAAIPETGLASQPWLVSSWLGQQVYDLNCEPIGQVSGLMVGQGNGQIMYTWVTLNQDLLPAPATTQAPAGSETPVATEAPAMANMVLIPWAATAAGQPEGSGQTCTQPGMVLVVDRAAVQGAPAFDAAPDTTVAGWDTDIQTYWSGQLTQGNLDLSQAGELFLIENISTWRVVDEGGSNFGPVKDLILDPSTGQVSYLVWSPGGFLQVSPRLVPVPLKAGKFDASSGHFILKKSLNATQVEQAPGFQTLSEAGNPADNPGWIQKAQDFWSQFEE